MKRYPEEVQARDKADKIGMIVFAAFLFAIGVMILVTTGIVPPSLDTLLSQAGNLWALLLVVGAPMLALGRVLNLMMTESAGSFSIALAFGVYAVALGVVSLPAGIVAFLHFVAWAIIFGFRGFALLGAWLKVHKGVDKPN